MTFEESYRTWRNRARRFSRESIIEKVFAALGDSNGTVDGLRNAPWNLLLILKWVCQDRMMTSGISITDAEFLQLRQDLWSFPERINLTIEGASGYLLFRQITAAQLRFQTPISRGFVRDAAIISKLPPNSILRRHFISSGFEPLQFIDFSYALFTAFSSLARRSVHAGYFEPIAQSYGAEPFNKFLRKISANGPELLDFFTAMSDRNRKVLSEYYEFPAVKTFPILRSGDNLLCWHPSVLFRGLEGFVHDMMTQDDEVFEKFTLEFEKHVVDQAKLLPECDFYSEDQLRDLLPPNSMVPDGLLSYSTANVFIESKAGVFDESLLTTGSPCILRSKTRRLARAVKQARSAASKIRAQNVAPSVVTNQVTDYLVVVTNREVAVSTAWRLETMYPSGQRLAFPDSPTLPNERIYFMNADSFERLVRGCIEQAIRLPDVLESCVVADSAPQTSVFYFDQHLDRLGFDKAQSHFIDGIQSEAFSRLARILGS